MAKDDPHFRLRIPAELKAEIEESAKANNRSINAEIVARLENAGDERRLLNIALTTMERIQEAERSKMEVMRWMRDQINGQSSVLESIAQSDGQLGEETLRLLREMVATRGKDNDFPLSREDIEALSSKGLANSELETDLQALKKRYSSRP
jgi:hypothetical protein